MVIIKKEIKGLYFFLLIRNNIVKKIRLSPFMIRDETGVFGYPSQSERLSKDITARRKKREIWSNTLFLSFSDPLLEKGI